MWLSFFGAVCSCARADLVPVRWWFSVWKEFVCNSNNRMRRRGGGSKRERKSNWNSSLVSTKTFDLSGAELELNWNRYNSIIVKSILILIHFLSHFWMEFEPSSRFSRVTVFDFNSSLSPTNEEKVFSVSCQSIRFSLPPRRKVEKIRIIFEQDNPQANN